ECADVPEELRHDPHARQARDHIVEADEIEHRHAVEDDERSLHPGAPVAVAIRGSVDDRARLLAHVLLQIIERSGALAGGTGSLPAAEGLEARPGASGRALRPVA